MPAGRRDLATDRSTRAWLLIAVAIGLVASQVVLANMAAGYAAAKPVRIVEVLPLIGLLSIPAALALLAVPHLAALEPRRSALVAMVGCGLAMRLVWLGVPAPLEDDYYRYLWDGALLAHGENPYAASPLAITTSQDPGPTLAHLREAGASILSRINFPELWTIYPLTAEAAFALAHTVAPWSLDGLRLVFIAADFAALIVLAMLLRRSGRSTLLASLYWLNPIVVHATTATAHVDGLVPPLVLGAILLIVNARGAAGLALVGLAAGVKVWPLLLAPVLIAEIVRRGCPPWFALQLLAAVTLAVLGPVLFTALGPASGLRAYSAGWANNNAPYAWASYGLYLIFGEGSLAQHLLRLALALAAGLVAICVARTPRRDTAGVVFAMMTVAAAVFYLSPAQFPWYAPGFLAFAAGAAYRPLLIASATLPSYYLFFPLWESGRGDLFLYCVAFLHVMPVVVAIAWHRRSRGSRQGLRG